MSAFDVVVIGAGPAGYVCAIRAAQLGMKVALVDKRVMDGKPALGGTCLNVGCIPSKALLESSHKYAEAVHGLGAHGVKVGNVSLDLTAMQARKAGVVNQLVGGVGMLMKKNKIEVVSGEGVVEAVGKVRVGDQILETKHIVIATGSAPVELPFAPFDHDVIIDSTDALALDKVPDHLIVIGAGVIGLEMGSVWGRLGAKVTCVDMATRPVAIMDAALGEAAKKVFEKQGMDFVLGAGVKSITVTGKKAKVVVDVAGTEQVIEGDKVLVSVGRRAYTAGLGLEAVGVEMDKRGVVQVDTHYATNIKGIYAIGDAAPGPMLAHKGEDEGMALAEILAGQSGHVNYGAIPWVVYTHPEIAGVGMTEEEARARGEVKVGKFSFIGNGRAIAVNETEGFVKVIADAVTDEMLGVHILGHNASEMIAEAAVLMEFKASAEDMARCCHAHPTMSEAVKEAALAVAGRAIHA
ncbi:MAG: dihydrolipoyl dehydrogenase [Alphaproteobacteria bacterium CG_4_10_14_0_8_um_filter_53_9]|nr:MAG: dihydrolipoyl dehydrogenase [Alphaproteobacteria bacterium CG_4_10_14_0_8_um_filter_53_9]